LEVKRSAARTVLITDAVCAALLPQMLTQQLSGSRIEQAHEQTVPLHLHAHAYIGLLYEVEREARDGILHARERLALRQSKARPALDDIRAYLRTETPKLLPKSAIGDAIDYTLKNWDAMVRYCEDGDMEIDNNGAEHSLRHIVVGRNNWLFYGSDHGG
jgi:hypothetical protein